ncbi:hypothetical protein SAMN05421540_106152 [Psychroflexus halocasei]|uniref:Uncharacterized protein n=1 Tax=Psychroflexus halocasei TaxID=908615 RepID=A0A1H4BT26_9FLAO|nr:hypothetical protein SAMN05421540_106152 [Psychroflexus halocasei]
MLTFEVETLSNHNFEQIEVSMYPNPVQSELHLNSDQKINE